MLKKYAAFTLIEVIIAGALAATTIGALFALVSMGTRLTVVGHDRLVASQLAREGLEAVRQIRDTNSIASVCTNCSDWRSRILTIEEIRSFSTATQPAMALKKIILDNQQGFALETSNAACPEVVIFNNQEYCRRIFIESVKEGITIPNAQIMTPLEDAVIRQNTLRVRSQISWLGNGRTQFRAEADVRNHPGCEPSADEWCIEQVTLLTNWRARL